MKKILTLGFAALLVAGLAGCVNEGFKKADNGTVLTLTGTQGDVVDENGTRVYHEGNKTYWNEGDAIGVFIDGQEVNNAELIGTTADNITATFSGALGTTLAEGTYTVYAYYPWVNIGEPSTEPYSERAHVLIPTTQTPEVNTFDAKSAVLYANPIEITLSGTHTSDFQAVFNYATTIANFVLADIAASVDNEPITSFKVTMPDNIAGRRELNLKTGEFGNWYSSEDFKSTNITATFDVEDNFVANGTNGIFIGMAPITVAEGATVLIEAQTAGYNITKTITVPREKVFTKGTINTIRISSPIVTAKSVGATLPWSDDFSFVGTASPNNASVSSQAYASGDFPMGSDVDGENFVSGERVYPGTNAVKFGSGSAVGTLTTRDLDLSEPFTVQLSLMGWGASAATTVQVTAGSQTQNVVVTGNDYAGFAVKSINFNAESNMCPIVITTTNATDRRFFIDDIQVYAQGEAPAYFTANADKDLTNVAAAGTTGTITISSNTTWLADCENWITLDIDNGEGDAEITYTILENESETPRGALDAIHFMADGVDEFIDIEVQQAGKVVLEGETFVLDNAAIAASPNYGSYGTNRNITAADGSVWAINAAMKSGSYLQFNTHATNPHIVSPTLSGQIKTVVVTATGSTTSGRTISIYDSTGSTVIAGPQTMTTTGTNISSAREYTFEIPSTYTGSSVVIKPANVVYIFAVTINGEAADPNTPVLKADVTSIDDVSSAGATGTIDVTANAAAGDWMVGSNVSWVEIAEDSEILSGNQTINYTVLSNGGAARSDANAIHITNGTIDVYIPVSQVAFVPTLQVVPTAISGVSADGTSGTITVTSNVDWALSTTDGWINFTSATSGVGNGSVNYTIAANSADATRDGIIYVTSTNYSSLNTSIAVAQLGQGGSIGVETAFFRINGTGAGLGGYAASPHSISNYSNQMSGGAPTTANFVVTYGANPFTLGANSSNYSNMTLGAYQTAFAPALSTLTYQKATALVCTTTFNDVTKIEVTTGTVDSGMNLAVVYSTDGGTTYQLKTPDATGKVFVFDSAITGLFSVVGYTNSGSGNARIQNVVVTYYGLR